MFRNSGAVFITGGAGFIGSHIAEYYSQHGLRVVVYDNFSSGNVRNIDSMENVEIINGDILDGKSVTKAMKGCIKVFHLAALVSVAESMKDPILTSKINIEGTMNVLNSMLSNGIKKIIFASSAAIYGNSEECPKTVKMLPRPVSPYAITKITGEYLLEMYQQQYGFNTIIARFFNVFGERQDPKSEYAAAVPIFITRALSNKTITIFGDGEQTRDFIYVKDLVEYITALSNHDTGRYNLGYGKCITINELVSKVIRYTSSSSKIAHASVRLGDVKHSYADVRDTNKKVKVVIEGFDKGLSRTIEYYRTLDSIR